MFDGQIVHFMGTCKYTLSRYDKKGDSCSYAVEVENERRRGNKRVSYTRLVDVRIFGRNIRLHLERRIYVDGKNVYLPYKTDQFEIILSGKYVRLETRCGLVVQFDGTHNVNIRVPNVYGNDLTGMCGNCNKNSTDDLKDFTQFEVVDDSDRKLKHCIKEESFHPCAKNPKYRIAGESQSVCRIINPANTTNNPFSQCFKHSKQDAEVIFGSCVYDYCAFRVDNEDGKYLENVLCDHVSSLADLCASKGIIVKWRTSTLCPLPCGPYSHYRADMTACPATCVDPEAPKTCLRSPVEGCECDYDYVLSNQRCVSEVECGCTDVDGEYYPYGTEFVSSDCSAVKQCKAEGDQMNIVIKERRVPCGTNAECKAKDGEYTCVCKAGHTGDPLKSCKAKECRMDVQGTDYQGIVSETATGQLCRTWNTLKNGKYAQLGEHNSCRNPKGEKSAPWCFLRNGKSWEYCDIPMCNGKKPGCISTMTLSCSSADGDTKWCRKSGIRYITWLDQIANTKCVFGETYGRQRDEIWVNGGCGGNFSICYKPDKITYRPKPTPATECKKTKKGTDYEGTWGITTSGRLCQSWSSQYPQDHNYHIKLAGESNYCRNPNSRKGPWCFVDDPEYKKRWEYCDIFSC
ncbi:zonadhesin-like [Pecten maximus]|uniref:zonadhesin-like n=1 Tax=Pecten maximus TaxID=6579 RepID=UPI0014591A65|nr:zonadhesin-like [Pecten maximus]